MKTIFEDMQQKYCSLKPKLDYKLNMMKRGQKMKNRGCCLYRVSTAKQVDHTEENKDDIPMQRKACREFAERMGWEIVREEQEAGVSGFKVSAADRDKLQTIKQVAEKGKFDILLMFAL